jgi:hypothetical protein
VCDIVARLPQVRRPAAEQLIMTADETVELLIKWMRDPEVPHGVRAKIAQDLADRASLATAQVHKIIPTTEDPVVVAIFWEAAERPGQFGGTADDGDHDVFDAEIGASRGLSQRHATADPRGMINGDRLGPSTFSLACFADLSATYASPARAARGRAR